MSIEPNDDFEFSAADAEFSPRPPLDVLERVDGWLAQLETLDQGPTRLALAEQAAQLADSHQLYDRAYLARIELTRAATYLGRPDKAIVAFTWCLHQPSACPDPDLYQLHVLSELLTVVDQLAKLPQIDRERVTTLGDEMEQRHREAGLSLKSAWMSRHIAALFMGDLNDAEQYHDRYRRAAPDMFSPDPPDDAFFTIQYLANTGRDAEAVAMAEPSLEHYGSPQGANPFLHHGLPAIVMLPLIRLGRHDEAYQLHRQSYPSLAPLPFCLSLFAGHTLTAAATGHLREALSLVESHLPQACSTTDLLDRFNFHRAAGFVMHRLREAGIEQLAIRLPASFPVARQACYQVDALARWFDHDVRQLASRFDRRNGNTYISSLIGRVAVMHERSREPRTLPEQTR